MDTAFVRGSDLAFSPLRVPAPRTLNPRPPTRTQIIMPKADKEAETAFTKAQKRKAAGLKAVLTNDKSTDEAKAKARKELESIEKDEKFETVGDRVRGRERNKEQEEKDEVFETIGDRVRSRTELSTGLKETKSPGRIIAGLKSSLKNANTTADRKKEIRDKLKELGVEVDDNGNVISQPEKVKKGKAATKSADKKAEEKEEEA
ncbi:hypothetical protein BKA62DRAFT_96654 [Auriculariales sp. MPI-PUGE-AT-0066]|nr:hypothetical protein BKA62DRAFT_96654 [Auriculariales sp. MPI-PUGE-AT-0066]